MATIIIQQPNDEPCIGVSEYNPYRDSKETLNEQSTQPIYFGTELCYFHPEIHLQAVELERFSTIIKFVSLFDSNIAIISLVFSGYPLLGFIILFNFCGYLGAHTFNKKLLYLYILFHVTMFISKIVVSIKITNQIFLGISAIFNLMMSILTGMFISLYPR